MTGFRVVRVDSVSSTQDEVRRLARGGEPEGVAVVARVQTSGRGRDGRSWASPPGMGLYVSVLLRPRVAPGGLGLLTLAAGVAVAEAAGVGRLKWPNDLVAPDGRKIAGVLAEAEAGAGGVDHVALGIGLNVRSALLDPGTRAAALDEFGCVDDEDLLGRLLDRLAVWYGRTDSPAVVLAAWRRLDCVVGRRVAVDGPGGAIEGEAAGVDATGALLLRTASGAVARVVAGDVHMTWSGM